ncbi:hypothetical protein [Chryseobacterium sp. Mn2064]|uniref:hypothetical protein n=1 Tax=Chryseobacterium sp. Mn2064 TaxID=3395263 RepID=UPI003BE625F2
MKTYIKIISVFGLLISLSSCKTAIADTSHQSDINKNLEELQKREKTEKDRVDITSYRNNYGKPPSK